MDWLTKLWNYITTGKTSGAAKKPVAKTAVASSKPIIQAKPQAKKPNEISIIPEMSEQRAQVETTRAKYFDVINNPNHTVKNGENLDKIAKKYGIETSTLRVFNSIKEEDAAKIPIGRVLKIPPTRKLKNVNNIKDIADAMGVSQDFVKRLKRIEDGENLPDNKFHNTPYIDKAGNNTIGIGHVLKSGDKKQLTDAEVCTLCAKDLLKVEDELSAHLGKHVYDSLPQGIKEALLDMCFNKGIDIIKDEAKYPESKGLTWCLKNGKYEAAINKFIYIKSNATGNEMSGLAKRRLLDISLAVKIYNGAIPQSNITTIQTLYNKGYKLLKKECKASGANFENMFTGYQKDCQSYFGNKIKLKLITE